MSKITAIYARRRVQDSGSENTKDYYVHEFTEVKYNGDVLGSKWIKETELMKSMNFIPGLLYKITLSSSLEGFASMQLPFPIEIEGNDERAYRKNGNQIIKVDKNNKETNLSVPRKLMPELSSFEMGAFNKFLKGTLMYETLRKMNDRNIFFSINITDPQDKRKTESTSYSYNRDPNKGNYVLIQQESQEKIDAKIKFIKQFILSKEIVSCFTIQTKILSKKK